MYCPVSYLAQFHTKVSYFCDLRFILPLDREKQVQKLLLDTFKLTIFYLRNLLTLISFH